MDRFALQLHAVDRSQRSYPSLSSALWIRSSLRSASPFCGLWRRPFCTLSRSCRWDPVESSLPLVLLGSKISMDSTWLWLRQAEPFRTEPPIDWNINLRCKWLLFHAEANTFRKPTVKPYKNSSKTSKLQWIPSPTSWLQAFLSAAWIPWWDPGLCCTSAEGAPLRAL